MSDWIGIAKLPIGHHDWVVGLFDDDVVSSSLCYDRMMVCQCKTNDQNEVKWFDQLGDELPPPTQWTPIPNPPTEVEE